MTLASKLARLAFPYGKEAVVLAGPARGMRFVVLQGMGASYALGTVDAAPRFFGKWIKPGDVVYDVGANKGQMTLIFAALVGVSGHIVSFEPAPVEFETLVHNLALNRLANVQAFQVALADFSGNADFDFDPALPTQGKLSTVEQTYQIPGATRTVVSATTIDSFLGRQRPPDVIKIDSEGSAAAVLRGARDTLRLHGPAVYLELHGPEEQAGVRDELISTGYEVQTLAGVTVEDPTSGWNSPLWCRKLSTAKGGTAG